MVWTFFPPYESLFWSVDLANEGEGVWKEVEDGFFRRNMYFSSEGGILRFRTHFLN